MTLANWIHPLLFRGGAEWSPLDLANLEIWLDAPQITGLSDGDPVVTWVDLTGNGNSPTQGVAGKRPLYKTGIINGLPVVRGDGVDDFLLIDPLPGGTIAQPLTIFVVCKFIATGTGLSRTIFDGGPVDRCVFYRKPQASPTWWFYGGNLEVDTGDAVDTNPHCFVCFYNGASSTVRMDGVEIGTGNPGTEGMEDLLLLENIAYDNAANADIAEFGLISAGLSAENIGLLETYLIEKWADEYFYYKVYDTFTDINGTDLDVHVPERGLWTEVDTGGLCDIQSNKAQITGAGVYTDPKFYAGPFSRVAGQEFVFTIKPGQLNQQMAMGLWGGTNLDPVTGDRAHLMWFFSDGNLYCREGAEPAAVAYTTDEVECKIVLKAVGAEYWYNGVKVKDLAVNNDDPLYIGVAAKGGTWDFDIMSFG